MKTKILFTIAALLALWWQWPTQKVAKQKVAILQTASHPALDRAARGFCKTIQEALGDDITIVHQNAEGQLPQARIIAKRFHLDKDVKAIFTIGSPATQMMTEMESIKPIIFCAVTDPTAFVTTKIPSNLTGCCDMVNAQQTVALVKQLVPEAKTVSILFCPSELNSVVMTQKLTDAMSKEGLKVVEIGLHLESEAATATAMAAKSGDVIIAPTDHLVASAAPIIARQAIHQKTPLIVSDNLLVPLGPLAARGVDYEASGRQAASMAVQLLQGEVSIDALPIQKEAESTIHINMKTLSTLGRDLPEELSKQAQLILKEG